MTPRLTPGANAIRDAGNFVKAASGDVHDQFVGLVVGEGESPAVEAEERDGGGESQSFVAVHQGVVTR
jgi:hypothetical protein